MSVALKNICLSYDQAGVIAPVLNDINFHVQSGECIGVMGRTGCGKTSLMQLTAGLLVPTKGQVFIDGEDIHAPHYDRLRLRQKLGFVFQYPEYQLFETTVERDVAFCLKYSSLSKAEKTARVRQALEDVGFDFEQIRRQSPLSLSGGEKRRVAIAGVLAAQPKILILDEPIAGLDPMAREDFLSLLETLKLRGVTIFMISHNAEALCRIATRLLVIDGGRLVLDDTPKEVMRDVEKLDALHLDVSFARRCAYLLQQKGVQIDQDIVEYDELLHQLCDRFGGMCHG